MYSRTLGLVAAASLVFAACGSDDGGSGGGTCTGTEMSVPGQVNDPCPQNSPACVAAGGKAYATCENGHWPKMCECITGSGQTGSMTMPSTAAAAVCGDTVITPPNEACDRTNLNGATCQTLGYNGGGTLLCNPTTCNYDTIMCRMTSTTSSGAGTSGGAGRGGGGSGT